MKNLNRFFVLATALSFTAGATHATERVLNGTFETDASLFFDNWGIIGMGRNLTFIPGWTPTGTAVLYSGVEGAATSLSAGEKYTFGPSDCGGRTFAVFQSTTATSQIAQEITLPAGYYKIQYDVACQSGQTVTYQVVVMSGGTYHYVHSNTANNAAFETVTGYFAGGGGTAPTIFLQNYTKGACVSYTNVSIQDATPPAPTVSNNTPLSQGATATLTASSPYTTDPNAFLWRGPALPPEGVVGANQSYGGAQASWSGTYSCTVTINGLTSPAASTEVVITSPITASQASHGTVSPAGVTNVNNLGSQNYSISADPGYAIADVIVDNQSVGAVTSYNFTSVATAHSITATYSLIPTTITVNQSANGTINPGTTTPTYGANQQFSITPSTGYAVATLTVDGSAVTPATRYTFYNVTTIHTITATFHTLYQEWLATHIKPDNEASLKEYAFGTTNPGRIAVVDSTHITLGQLPEMQITEGVVTAIFGRRTNDEGLTYTVEFCDDLGRWYPSTDTEHLRYGPGADPDPVVIAHEGDMDAVSVPFPIFIKVGTEYVKMSKTFMRIVVTTH